MIDKSKEIVEIIDGYGRKWSDEVYEIQEQMRTLGINANPNSLPQVANYIYDVLKLKPIGEGESARSLSNYALSRLVEQHEYPRLMVEHRRLFKKYMTYWRFRKAILEEQQSE